MIARRNMNREAVDGWTLVHAGAGVVAGVLGIPSHLALGLAIGYEVIEQGIERTPQGRQFFGSDGPESLVNAVVDVVVFAIGHHVGRAI